MSITRIVDLDFVGSGLVRICVSLASLFPLCAFLVALALPACATRQLPRTNGGQNGSSSGMVYTESRSGLDEHEEDEGDSADPEVNPTNNLGALPKPAAMQVHPLANASNSELEKKLKHSPESLGSASIGRNNAGALFNGKVLPSDPRWKIVNTKETYGTSETVAYLQKTIIAVNKQFPESPALSIGDISQKGGGHLNPHSSHQAGRDVDLGFYYNDQSKWYATATKANLDLPRTWAFLKATVIHTDVDMVFVDHAVQRLLRDYAESIGEDLTWLDEVFGGPRTKLRPIVLHEKGHRTHFHVRYYNPIAQETGRRLYKLLIKHKVIKPPTSYLRYKVKKGDSLRKIARKYKTKVKAIKKLNRLKNSRIYAGRTYKVPRKTGVAVPAKLVLPQRRLPPVTVPIHASSVHNSSTEGRHTLAP